MGCGCVILFINDLLLFDVLEALPETDCDVGLEKMHRLGVNSRYTCFNSFKCFYIAFINWNVDDFCVVDVNLGGRGTKKHAGHLLRYQNQWEMTWGQVIDRRFIESGVGLSVVTLYSGDTALKARHWDWIYWLSLSWFSSAHLDRCPDSTLDESTAAPSKSFSSQRKFKPAVWVLLYVQVITYARYKACNTHGKKEKYKIVNIKTESTTYL